MQHNTNTINTSWAAIVIALVLFWPIGLFLLFRKVAVDRSAAIRCGRPLILISYALFFFSFVYISLMLSDGISFFIPALLTGVGGFFLRRTGKRMRDTSTKYKQYIAIVVNQGETSLDNIAGQMGLPFDIIQQDLQKMITLGYFKNARIDHGNRQIIFAPMQMPNMPHMGDPGAPAPRVVICPGCGANNRVLGYISECEYCGSALA